MLPPEAYYDLMVVSTGTRRVWPLKNVGPLTDEYSLTSDWDNQWLTGGLEPDVIAEAHLDVPSIVSGIKRFADARAQRLERQRELLKALGYVRLAQDRPRQAILALQAAKRRAPNDLEVLINLGWAHFRAHDVPAAIDVWERALALDPSNDSLRRDLDRARRRTSLLESSRALV